MVQSSIHPKKQDKKNNSGADALGDQEGVAGQKLKKLGEVGNVGVGGAIK